MTKTSDGDSVTNSSFFARLQAYLNGNPFKYRKKLSLSLQSEASECGLACLTMVAQYYDLSITLSQLRDAFPNCQRGVNIGTLAEISNQIGFISRAIKLDIDELPQMRLPAILHWDFKHFVVLERISRKSFTIVDPAVGRRKHSCKEFGEHFTGVLLELTFNKRIEHSGPNNKLKLRHFLSGLIGFKRQFVVLVLLSILLQALALLSPFYLQLVVDKVVMQLNESMLSAIALGFALILLVEVICYWTREKAMLRLSHHFMMTISSRVFTHLLSLPMRFYQQRHMGDIVSRFSALQKIRDIITQGLISVILDGLLSLLVIGILYVYSPTLLLIVLSTLSLYLIIRLIFYFPLKTLNQEVLIAEAAQQSYFMQSVKAICTLKISNKLEPTAANWLDKYVDHHGIRAKLENWHIRFQITNKLLFGVENLLLVYVAASLVLAQEFSLGMLFAFMSYKNRFIQASTGLVDKFIEFKLIQVHLDRLEDIILSPADSDQCLNNKLDEYINANLRHSEFESANLSIEADKDTRLRNDKLSNPSHNNNEHILSGESDANKGLAITLSNIRHSNEQADACLFCISHTDIKAGEHVAIVGKSGAGKSSLIMMLCGLNKPNAGKILLNNTNLTAENRRHFRIAAVLQNDQLLNGSILQNISHFDNKTDMEKLVFCAKMACIDRDIKHMPMQYQTLIGDMGSTLSGGQKQRILLARALYQEPKLLILDEATSHLDVITERQICTNLKRCKATIVMVAHRPQAIKTASRILKLSATGLTELSYSSDKPTGAKPPTQLNIKDDKHDEKYPHTIK